MLEVLNQVIADLGCENKDCHTNLPRGSEYRMLKPGGGAVSVEEAMFLAGVVWVTRPDVVIELGTSMGTSALILAAACKGLGKGSVMTIDIAKDKPLTRLIADKYELPLKYILETNSMDFLKEFAPYKQQYLVFSDTDIPLRPQEVNLVIEKFPKGTVIVVHDTSDLHPFGPMKLASHVSRPIVELPSPRGISILRS